MGVCCAGVEHFIEKTLGRLVENCYLCSLNGVERIASYKFFAVLSRYFLVRTL